METGRISEGPGGSPGLESSGSDKGEIRSVLASNHIAHRGLQNHPKRALMSGFSLRFSRDLRGTRGPSLQPGKTALQGVRRARFSRRQIERPKPDFFGNGRSPISMKIETGLWFVD